MYKIVDCPICKHLQITVSESTMTCKYCGKTTSMKRLQVYYSSTNHKEVLSVLYKLQNMQKDKLDD